VGGSESDAGRAPHGMVLAFALLPLSAPMNTTMRRLAQTLRRKWCPVLAGALVLVGEAHLSPVAGGQLDALVVSMRSLEDGGSRDDLNDPDKILTLVRESLENSEPVFVYLGLLTDGPLTGEFGDSLIYALDPSPEGSPEELADRSSSPTVMEGIWAFRFGSKDPHERVHLAADVAGPGLYNDPDWLEGATLVLIGSGAGATLVFLGFSRLRGRRRHKSGPRPSHRPHYNFHRSRRRAYRVR
jgi:hypothetical protein